MKIQTPKCEFKNLAVKVGKDLHDLKNGKIIIIKGADKGTAVVVWNKEDYIKKAGKQLGVNDIYEEGPHDP